MGVDELFAKLAKINIKNVPTDKLDSYIFAKIRHSHHVIQTKLRLNGRTHFISSVGYVSVIISNRYIHVYFLAFDNSQVLILSDNGFTLIDAEKPPTHGIRLIPITAESRENIVFGGISGNLHEIDDNIECVDIRKWPQKLIKYVMCKCSGTQTIVCQNDTYMIIERHITRCYINDKEYVLRSD